MAVTETGHLASREIDDLYRRHGSEVYRYAFAVLGNRADAEDVTQTTFLNAYRALEQGVRPRKPSNWLLAIASNSIKQRFRAEQVRPRQVVLDERTAGAEIDDVEGPTVGELLGALSKIPPQQRQAIVLREFEGRPYAEIAEILGVTTSALETLLFRARRSLAEELEHQLTCTEAQQAVSRAADGRLGRKERRRLRDHLGECPDCARFASVQQRHRRALKGLMLLPVPLSLHFVKGIEGSAAAATLPASAGAIAVGAGAGATTTGGVFAGGAVLKAAAAVAAATMAGGVVVSGASETGVSRKASQHSGASQPGSRLGQVAPRGVLVPGNGVARGKARAPGQAKAHAKTLQATGNASPATRGASAYGQGRVVTHRAGGNARLGGARAEAATKPTRVERITAPGKRSDAAPVARSKTAARSDAGARTSAAKAAPAREHGVQGAVSTHRASGGPNSP